MSSLKKDPQFIVSAILICLYAFIAIACSFGWVATDFNQPHEKMIHQAPSMQFWMGTDVFGRNVLSRALQGTKIAFLIGIFSATLAVFIGTLLGMVAGYFQGWWDDVIQWIYTTLDSIPSILLLSAFIFALGSGLFNTYLALGLTSWIPLCRMLRAEALSKKQSNFVMSARSLGFPTSRILFFEILPNEMPLILIQFALIFIQAIKVEVILSYLGLGVDLGTPSWGMMIDDSKVELTRGIWWNMAAASVLMFGLIAAIYFLVDSLRRHWEIK